MSTWTHVVGIIRVDGIPNMTSTVDRIKQTMGEISTYDDHRETDIPQGSEGSLQYQVIEYSTGFPWVVIPIWGDLRDYMAAHAVLAWFQKKCEQLEFIRDAVISIEVEGGEKITWKYQYD